MALIDELKEKREVWLFNVALHDQRVVDECLNASRARKMVADLDRAIAAITPAIDFAAEQETAREQLEREPEIPEEGLGSSLIAMGYGDDPDAGFDAPGGETHYDEDAEASAREERPALNEAMQDEREEPVALAQPEWNEPEAHIQAVEAERYALATNPEADFWSRGLASDQKPQSRFNIFGIKPKVDA